MAGFRARRGGLKAKGLQDAKQGATAICAAYAAVLIHQPQSVRLMAQCDEGAVALSVRCEQHVDCKLWEQHGQNTVRAFEPFPQNTDETPYRFLAPTPLPKSNSTLGPRESVSHPHPPHCLSRVSTNQEHCASTTLIILNRNAR